MAKLGSAAPPPRPPVSSADPGFQLNSSSRNSFPVLSSSNRPPSPVVIGMTVNALLSLGTLTILPNLTIVRLAGAVFGMFGSVILLGIFRQQINLARADGKFKDWRISSNSVATVMTFAAWLAGAGNLFLICYELTRSFTT